MLKLKVKLYHMISYIGLIVMNHLNHTLGYKMVTWASLRAALLVVKAWTYVEAPQTAYNELGEIVKSVEKMANIQTK